MFQRTKKIAVVGAGIAGLASAYYLRKRGYDVEIFESSGSAGGAVRSQLKEEKYLVELGPNAFLASADPLLRLSRELSIEPLIVGSEDVSCKRYVHRHGRLHELPVKPGTFLKSGIMSAAGKARLFFEPFIKSKSPETESLADFVTRRAGREVLEALVDPFASGVWAGNPSELEMKSVLPKIVEVESEYGSVFKGMRKLSGEISKKGLLSFRWGLGTLTARLEEELSSRIRFKHPVAGIEPLASGRFKIRLEGNYVPMEACAVVIAAPAYVASKIFSGVDKDISSLLSAIPYVPLAVVHTAFKTADVPRKLDGFGVLVPRAERIRLLGSIWSSAMFDGRAPKGEALITNFIGGATDIGLIELSDDEIIEEVLRGLESVMGIKSSPKFVNIKRWANSIPQYTIGHGSRIEKIRSRIEKIPRVFLTGSYFNGVSVSDTIADARKMVDRLSAEMGL